MKLVTKIYVPKSTLFIVGSSQSEFTTEAAAISYPKYYTYTTILRCTKRLIYSKLSVYIPRVDPLYHISLKL